MRFPLLVSLLLSYMIIADAQNPLAPSFAPVRQVVEGEWQFRQAHTGDWKPTVIPASVHTALLANGMIEDPYYRENESKLQWIEREDWEFETQFDVPDHIFNKKHIELIFKGLDTYAHVYLNDSLIVEADNMFRTWRVDAKRWLKPTGNRLHIYFESPLKKTDADWKNLGYELPGGQRTMTRKAQFHYGWDWGPRLVGSGILAKPELFGWDDFKFQDVFFTISKFSTEKVRVVAHFRYQSDIDDQLSVILRNGKGKAVEDRVIQYGVHSDSVWFDIDNPKLWWCVGMGEPHLYDFALEIRKNARVLERHDARVGLRKIELVTEPDADGKGSSFYFRLNGVPVFAKGANYIPQDMFQNRVTGEHYRRLIDDVLASNMNMLRVWGGGIYEDDTFYQLCDAHGILVWQDFMYACALYPGNGAFVKNAAAEGLEQIERLRQHACIALWCGNNENNEAWHNWGWQMQFSETQRNRLWRDYTTLFNDILRTYVENNAGGVPYWESSPSYGRANPKSLTEGDSHYWGVWHDEEPFSTFDKKVPRFMSEFGFQSFPEWRTILSFTLPEDRQLESPVMLAHQKHPRGNALIAEYTRREYRAPKNFEDFVYVSQLVQAEGMRTGLEAHRRNKPYCMGTLYWQLNDVWPVASWASRDYYGRWKALQYFARDAFAPIAALPLIEGDELKVFGVNDMAHDTTATLQVRVLDFGGDEIRKFTTENALFPADSSRLLWQLPLKNLIGKRVEDLLAEITVVRGKQTLHRRLVYFTQPKNLALSRCEVKMNITAVENGDLIRLSTNRLAKNVVIQTEADGFFSDNYFDLLPGENKTVYFRSKNNDEIPVFKIKTLADTFGK